MEDHLEPAVGWDSCKTKQSTLLLLQIALWLGTILAWWTEHLSEWAELLEREECFLWQGSGCWISKFLAKTKVDITNLNQKWEKLLYTITESANQHGQWSSWLKGLFFKHHVCKPEISLHLLQWAKSLPEMVTCPHSEMTIWRTNGCGTYSMCCALWGGNCTIISPGAHFATQATISIGETLGQSHLHNCSFLHNYMPSPPPFGVGCGGLFADLDFP